MALKIEFTKKQKQKDGNQPFEFGKAMTALIVVFLLINFEAIIITSFVLMFIFGDLTPLSELLIGTFTVIGTIVTGAVGFYQWKTKAINIVKIKQALGMQIKDDDINRRPTSYWDSYGSGYGSDFDDENSVG